MDDSSSVSVSINTKSQTEFIHSRVVTFMFFVTDDEKTKAHLYLCLCVGESELQRRFPVHMFIYCTVGRTCFHMDTLQ